MPRNFTWPGPPPLPAEVTQVTSGRVPVVPGSPGIIGVGAEVRARQGHNKGTLSGARGSGFEGGLEELNSREKGRDSPSQREKKELKAAPSA